MAAEFAIGEASGVATNVTNAIIGVLFQQLNDVRNMGDNLQLLNTELARMDESLHHIQTQFEHQQRQLPEMVEGSLGRMKDALEEVKALIDRANRQRGRCRGCCLFFSPKIPADIREWKTRFNELFGQLDSDLSRAAHAAQIVGFAQPQADVLLQPLPESGFVGSGIEAAQRQLLSWLNEPHPEARVIGVWGMAGVGKTALLQLIYNDCKKVSTSFDLVIWHTISQTYQIQSLQDTIAEHLSLDLKGISSVDTRKMKLYDSLKDKRFILVLDDLWSPINLNEVGVNFGRDKNSRVLISSRYRNVVEIMAEKEYCMMIRPLSEDEGWELFQKTAFKSGAAQDKNLEVIARQVASECKGLPLAINTVAAAIARNKNAEEWRSDLDLMKTADPSFPSTHETIEVELYQKLRWSYEKLPNHGLKMCFLYCAAFPEDADINVERLVEMLTAERLFLQKGKTYFMDVGRKCIEALVDRCLIEYVDAEKREIKIHDVLRDMAIYIGQGEENCLFQAGQHLQNFPSEEETRDCKRISVLDNEISDLPPDFKCPTLVSLVLAGNRELKEIPEGFLVNCMSLKVLDLYYTSIKTLPTAVGQLGQLEFLNLKGCRELEDLPDSICSLSHLQFLNLEDCERLDSLPDKIGELKNLKHLTVSGSNLTFQGYSRVFRVIPHQISQLTSLNKLVLFPESTPMCLEDLTNLSNLIELDVTVKPEIKGGSMSTWSKMRKLRLRFEWGEDEKRDDAALDILPQNMQSMEELQSLELEDYQGVSLPTCICQFQNLKNLVLRGCMNLESVVCNAKTMPQLHSLRISDCGGLKILRMEELPNLRQLDIEDCAELKELFMESGCCFPQLEKLGLSSLRSLESIVCNAKTMPQLHYLWILNCGVLKTLRMEELPNLRKLYISDCAELKELFMESGGCFPQLEELSLFSLRSLESIVCNAKTMPQLHSLRISDCGGLKTLRMEELPNLRKLDIQHCAELKTLRMEELPNLRELEIEDCAELKELFMESGGCFPQLEKLRIWSLRSLESIVCNAKTMPQLHSLLILHCGGLKTLRMEELPNFRELVIPHCAELKTLKTLRMKELPNLRKLDIRHCAELKTLRMEELPNLRELDIRDCAELKELFMESGGCFPQLEELSLSSLRSLESILCNAKTMPQLHSLRISHCGGLKTLRMEELPNLRKLNIQDCAELKTLRMEELPNLRELDIRDCAELKELFMESGGCFPQLEKLSLSSLRSLESIVCNAKTMPQLHSLQISHCGGLKTLRMEELPNLRKLHIGDCAELKELFMESGGCFPQLEELSLSSLRSLESIVCNAKTMPQLHYLLISHCGGLKTLRMEELPNLRKLDIWHCAELKTLRMEELPNLRELYIRDCAELKELFMESGGCFPQLEKLSLSSLRSLESIVCNAKTMPQLHSSQILNCGGLKTLRMEELPNLRELYIRDCAELKELFMESGGYFPQLEKLSLYSLLSLESIVCNAKTMPQLHSLWISNCGRLKTLRMEELPNLRELDIRDCAELKELFMESGGCFPQLEELILSSLRSLESIVCNAKTMPQLHSLWISNCGRLKTLRMEEFPNLQRINICECLELEVEIESLPMLKELYLEGLEKAESIARPSSVWNSDTMPNLEVVQITGCPLLRRMPREMEKLPKLKKIVGNLDWWGWNKLGD